MIRDTKGLCKVIQALGSRASRARVCCLGVGPRSGVLGCEAN